MPELALWNNSVSNLRKPCGRRSFITRWSRLRRHARRTKTPSDGQSHSHFGHGIRPKAKERNVDGEASVHSLSLSPVSHSQKADQPLSNSFFPKKKKIFFCWYGFEFKRSRAVKPRGRQKAKLFFFRRNPVKSDDNQKQNFYVHHSTDPQSDVARALGWAAIYVQDFDAPCVLQFAWISALCCALHRSTSQVIHRSGSFLKIIFIFFSFLRQAEK